MTLVKVMKRLLCFYVVASTMICFCYNRIYAQTIDIHVAQGLIVSNSPKLQALTLQLEKIQKRIPQVSALDDPKITFGVNNLPVSSFSLKESDMTSKGITVSQMFPLFGKLSTKEQIAVLEYQKMRENIRLYQSWLLHECRTLFYELKYFQNYIELIDETKKYLTLLLESQKARSITAMGTLSDILKVSIELSKLQEERIKLEDMIFEKQEKIIYYLGIHKQQSNKFATDTMSQTIRIDEIDIEESTKTVLNNNPELAILTLQSDIDEREIYLSEKKLYPDVELGISYMQRDASPEGKKRDDMISIMATFNIPLWFMNKNIPLIQEKKIQRSETQLLYEDKKNEIISTTSIIASNIKKWKDLADLYENSILPQLNASFNSDLAQYKASNVEFMKLIDTIRLRLQYQRELFSLYKEYSIAHSFLNFLRGDTSIK